MTKLISPASKSDTSTLKTYLRLKISSLIKNYVFSLRIFPFLKQLIGTKKPKQSFSTVNAFTISSYKELCIKSRRCFVQMYKIFQSLLKRNNLEERYRA